MWNRSRVVAESQPNRIVIVVKILHNRGNAVYTVNDGSVNRLSTGQKLNIILILTIWSSLVWALPTVASRLGTKPYSRNLTNSSTQNVNISHF